LSKRTQYAIVFAILIVALVGPPLIAQALAPPPRTRRIHVEHFRYGMQPEVIHVNRGDTLIFTFSARDTAHSFFLQEYDLDVKIPQQTGQAEVTHPSDPENAGVMQREVVFKAGRPGLMGLFNTKCRYRCHAWCGQMHAFEQGFFVVHPNYLYCSATGVLCALPLVILLRWRWRRAEPQAAGLPVVAQPGAAGPAGWPEGVDLFKRWPWLARILRLPGLQYWLMTAASIPLYIVLLTCLIGTKMAGGNLGIMLMWVIWLVLLIAVLVPIFGRVWCTICPLPMFGDALQRGTALGVRTAEGGRYNSALRGLMLKWPERLNNVGPRTLSFLCFGTISTLVLSQPRWTAWAIILLLVLATFLPLIFELRTFCRYFCPVNSFISLYAMMSKLSLRARRPKACERCVDKGIETCRKGNDAGWACPYGLTVGQVDSSAECGLCLECLRSCSFQNVSVFWRPFGMQRLLSTKAEALQAIVMLTLGIVYCVTFQGPWHTIRDMVNVVDKDNWELFTVYSATLWLVTLGLVPLVVYLLSRLGTVLSGTSIPGTTMFMRDASALVPLGLFVWIAFAIPMLMISGSFVLSTLSDPFNWGWDLFGTAGQPWWQIYPEAIPWIQGICVLIGFALALRTSIRVWSEATTAPGRALGGILPNAMLVFLLTYGLIWFFTD
jgi:polyferredoxin